MKLALIEFPGSNCGDDRSTVLHHCYQQYQVTRFRYDDRQLPDDLRGVIIAGGFSFGDYLRAGALASQTPIASELLRLAKRQCPIIGICNGMQILCELGLLPGVLLANEQQLFIAKTVTLVGGTGKPPYELTDEPLSLPIAHAHGRYYHQHPQRLLDEGAVTLRYADSEGRVTDSANPNGSVANIAAVQQDRVMGLMPHPERAWHPLLGGSIAGLAIWQAFLAQTSA